MKKRRCKRRSGTPRAQREDQLRDAAHAAAALPDVLAAADLLETSKTHEISLKNHEKP